MPLRPALFIQDNFFTSKEKQVLTSPLVANYHWGSEVGGQIKLVSVSSKTNRAAVSIHAALFYSNIPV